MELDNVVQHGKQKETPKFDKDAHILTPAPSYLVVIAFKIISFKIVNRRGSSSCELVHRP